MSGNNSETFLRMHVIHIVHYIVFLIYSISCWLYYYPISWTKHCTSIRPRLSNAMANALFLVMYHNTTLYVSNFTFATRETNKYCILLRQPTDAKNASLKIWNKAIRYSDTPNILSLVSVATSDSPNTHCRLPGLGGSKIVHETHSSDQYAPNHLLSAKPSLNLCHSNSVCTLTHFSRPSVNQSFKGVPVQRRLQRNEITDFHKN